MALLHPAFFKSFIFGIEDSLVSTVGLVSGVALAGVPGPQVLMTGIVLVFVEAFSMAAGEYLSQRSAEEYARQSEVPPKNSFIASTIMFVSYLGAGVIPIAPYLFFAPQQAFAISVAASLVTLFALGAAGARITNTPVIARASQMAAVGGAAIILGIAVGQFLG